MGTRQKVFIIIIFSFLFLLVFGAGIYAWRYQKMVNRVSAIVDEHCLVVNSLIIERKNRSRDFMQAILEPSASVSAEMFDELTRKYYSATMAYVDGENDWLLKLKAVIDSREFRILAPSVIQKAANLELLAYEADREGSVAMLGVINSFLIGENQAEKDMKKVIDSTMNKDKYWVEYDKLFADTKNNRDPRPLIFRPPPSKCPPENFDFPNIFDFPKKPVGAPTEDGPLV